MCGCIRKTALERKKHSLQALFSSSRNHAVLGLYLSGGKTSTCTARAQRREHAQCVRVRVRTPCCACPLLRIRVPEHSVRSVGPEPGLFIQSPFFLTTWDSPGRFTDLSCLELKCACMWGGASEFWAGRAVRSGAFEEEGLQCSHLSPHKCRDAIVLALVAGEEGQWEEEGRG